MSTQPDAASVPLLSKRAIYHEDCAGCRLDRQKAASEGKYPYAEIIYIWVVILSSALPIQVLFPFLYFMIRDLKIAKTEEDIGFYAGFIGCAYMVGRAISSVAWGIYADRYGRKPVILISVLSVIVFNTLFGLSSSYWMAIITRGLLGLVCGVLGPIKAYASEVVRKEYQALSLSVVSSSRAVGLILGPAIGGFLAQPAEKYPSIFPKNSIFGRFPYFLPCFVITIFAACTFVACLWIPETLHTHKKDLPPEKPVESLEESLPCSASPAGDDSVEGGKSSILNNWPLLSAIMAYCLYSLQEMGYVELFALWAVSDKSYGGLGFTSEDVGTVLTFSGFGILLYQIFVYRHTVNLMGPVTAIRVVSLLTLPLLCAYPYMSSLSGILLLVVVNVASLIKNIFSITILTWCNILMNESVTQAKRGAANGLSITVMSIFKAVAPAVGGILFTLAQKRQKAAFLPGDQLIFFCLNVVNVMLFLWTCKPFLMMPPGRPRR